MNKFSKIRRDLIKGVATSVPYLALFPNVLNHNLLKNKLNESSIKSESNEISMPPLFDCNKYIGPDFPERADFPKALDLLEHMDRLSIDRAIAWHTQACTENPMNGNKQLINEIESSNSMNRIVPSLVVTPTLFEDANSKKEFLNLVQKHNIRAFHFFLNVPWTNKKFDWTILDLMPVVKILQPYNPVLFIDARGSNLELLKEFAQKIPKVAIVVGNCSQSGFPILFNIMETCPNIYIDTTFLYIYHSIEYIINRFGVERLIFGAGYKSNNGASIAILAHVDINKDEAHSIAHGNLEQLLNIKNPLVGSKSITGNKLWHKLLRREELGPKIIDAHSHLFYTSNSYRYYWCKECIDFDMFVKHAVQSMKSMGVHKMLIAGFENPFWPSLKANSYLAENVKKYTNYFNGYLVYNPDSEHSDKLLSNLDSFFSNSFFIGFKLLNDYWKIPVTDPRFNPIWEYANTHRLPILVHTWTGKYDSPKMLTDIIGRYPNAIFILGHSGSNDRVDAENLAIEYSNVYLEWCGSFYNPTDWREALSRIGNKKLLYGSDGMYHYPAYEMGRLLSMDLPDETLIPILGENMNQILKLRKGKK